MVRLQLLSRKMKQNLDEQGTYPGFPDTEQIAGNIKELYPHQMAPATDQLTPEAFHPGLTGGAGMSSGHINNVNGNTTTPQHYCLRWNNHQHNLLDVLASVLTSQQHSDVSLFCEGHVIRVHKLVLSASSTHFERILEASPPGQQPFIILDGTRYDDLRALVDYMYRGEVNIQQEQLTSLLKTADNLKIKGLADVATKEEDDGGGGPIDAMRGSRERINSALSSPSTKRSKTSPTDSGSSSTTSSCRGDTTTREPLQLEPRDLSRDAPRDLSRDLGGHFGLAAGYASAGRSHSPAPLPALHNLTPSRGGLLYNSAALTLQKQAQKSPVSTVSNSYLPSIISRPRSPHHPFDLVSGSSLHSPQPATTTDHSKIVSQISNMNPFGLNFSLPLLHESKKKHERVSHKLIASHYSSEAQQRDDREFLPPTWPPRGADHDMDRDREYREIGRRERSTKECERDWDREKEKVNEVSDGRSLRHVQEQLIQSQMYHVNLRNDLQARPSSPIQQQQLPSQSSLRPQLEKMESADSETDRRTDEDKFSTSTDKDASFSPPDNIKFEGSISSKAEYTPEADHQEEDEESSNGESVRDGITSNVEITSTISSTVTNGIATSKNSSLKNSESIKCPYCHRLYRHQNNLRTHIRCFHKGVRIPCPICNRGFTRWFTVRCHIEREHRGQYSRLEDLPSQLRRAIYPPFTD